VIDSPQFVVPGPAPQQLFGAPNFNNHVLGTNSLVFNQIGDSINPVKLPFNSSASNGTLGFTDGLLSTTIMATNAQQPITSLSLSEFGGYSLIGGTAAGTKAGISIDTVQAMVREINGVPVAPFVLPKTVSYPEGNQFTATALPQLNQTWHANVSFDLSQAVGATKIDLVLDNTLFTMSEQGSIAYIDKKAFEISTTVMVPEPGTIILGLIGGLGMVMIGRKTWKKA